MAAGLALVLLVFLFFIILYRTSAARYRTRPLVAPTEAEIVLEFQRRRSRLLYWAVIPFVGALSAMLLIGPIPYYPLQQRVEPALGLIVLLSGLSALGMLTLIYRCPSCGQVPRGGRFVDLNPETCPACGVRLK